MSALATAETALRVAQSDPARAEALANDALTRASDALARVVAQRALGMAAKARQDWLAARHYLEQSISTAIAAQLAPRVAAETRASLAPVLWYLGDTPGAMREIDLAAPDLTGAVAARLEMNRGFIMQREGRLDEALQVYRRALPVMRRLGDVADEASVLTNRAILYAYRGEFSAAEADLVLAERLHARLGQKLQAADVRHNLGFIASRKGDIPTALLRYDAAERERAALGVSSPQSLIDRCEALLTVRLIAEARRVGEVAVARLAAAGLEPEVAEARLLLAQAALLDGDGPGAREVAQLARSSFQQQRRLGWMALADYAILRADFQEATLEPRALRRAALRSAADLDKAGWAAQALDCRILAAQAAIERGAAGEAIEHLRKSAPVRRWDPADLRVRAWYAQALLRHARRDRRGTTTALLAAMRAFGDSREVLGATELRVHAAAEGQDIADLGTRLALESRRARRVLAWTERCRSMSALGRRPPRPPSDAGVAECLERLRHVVSRVEEAALGGADTRPLLRQQAALEAEIRHKTRLTLGEKAGYDRLSAIDELQAAVGDGVLVEVIQSDGILHAVTLTATRVRLHRLGPTAPVTAQMSTLRFALGRLVSGRASTASSEAARQLAGEMAGELDRQLLAPLRREIRDRPMVLVPTGILHALPWVVLPTCRGRPITVCPSAGLWLKGLSAVGDRHGGLRALLVAGPGLVHAPAEVEDLCRVYPHAETLVGCEATSQRLGQAAAVSDLVHIAAHGSFRDDNPLMSSLRLADGPMTVYDFEGLPSQPRCVVLSACDTGLSAVRPGEELMGLTATLLGAGNQALVASVTPVRDDTSRALMVDFHKRLSTGSSPAHALAEAQEGLLGGATEQAYAGAGFVCFGAGLQPV